MVDFQQMENDDFKTKSSNNRVSENTIDLMHSGFLLGNPLKSIFFAISKGRDSHWEKYILSLQIQKKNVL